MSCMDGDVAGTIGVIKVQTTACHNITRKGVLPGKGDTAALHALTIQHHGRCCIQCGIECQVADAAEMVGVGFIHRQRGGVSQVAIGSNRECLAS